MRLQMTHCSFHRQFMVSAFTAATFLALFCPIGHAQEPVPKEDEATKDPFPKTMLITKDFPGETWTFFSGKKDAKFEETWKYTEDSETGVAFIVCTGKPNGYLRSKKKFRNFEFGLEWRFPSDENGNSGVLLYTTGDNRIWPTSVQVQLQQPFAGSIFPIPGAKSSNEIRNVPMLSRPVNQWNRCVIKSIDGAITVSVNDQSVGTVTDCTPLEGAISLQSEGSEIHFRNIWIREFPSEKPVTTKSSQRKQKRFQSLLQRKRLAKRP